MRLRESFNVRFWKIRTYKGKRGRTYTVRWTVGGQEFDEPMPERTLADSRLAELRTFAREGTAFDMETGLPVPEVRKAQTEAAKSSELSWYEHAVRYVARRWDGQAGNSRRSTGETLATVTPALLTPGKGRPDDKALQRALYGWAFRNRPDPPEDIVHVLEWVADHSKPLADLADVDVMLDVLDAISRKLDGKPAAANTIARKRAVLSNVLDYAIGRGLETNPLPRAAKMWTKPKTTEGVVDPRVVINRRQADRSANRGQLPGTHGPAARRVLRMPVFRRPAARRGGRTTGRCQPGPACRRWMGDVVPAQIRAIRRA